ncbi:uncharacterized protein LOC121416476 [Lytechinus variegatus]|uniref:uncharacterized protein LOC121416476 n=1 Tax=Lytechinus variegatus TaxID=7654 RepID=UPI001BB1A94C|nr:uncharacterized protein LOC121416476 [Lytechinus variegatus]
MSTAGTLNKINIYPFSVYDPIPERMAWEDDFLPYISCATVSGVDYGYGSNITTLSHYQMISKCPSYVLAHSVIRTKCENPQEPDEELYTPVTVESIGHFRNLYCALCHDISTGIELWSWKWYCDYDYGGSSRSGSSSDSNENVRTQYTETELMKGFCSKQLEPSEDLPNDMYPRHCYPGVDVTSCSSEPTKCPSYLAPIVHNGTIYQNLHCAYCNGIDVCADYLDLCKSITYDGSYPVSAGFAFAEFFNFIDRNQEFACAENEAFDPLSRKCQLLFCFTGFEYNTTTKQCERLPVDEKGRLFVTFYSLQDEVNMTSLDTDYLLATVNNVLIQSPLDTLTFPSVVSVPQISCIPTGDSENYSRQSICQVCLDTELNFTTLPQTSLEFYQGTAGIITNATTTLYMPSLGNLSMIEILIDVPAGWDCESHNSWTFSDYGKPTLLPFRINFTRERADYIMSVSSIGDVCTGNTTRLACDTYVKLDASQFEIVKNQSRVFLHFTWKDTVLLDDEFQIGQDGSALYCQKVPTYEERNLPPGLDTMNTIGNALSVVSVLIIITTYATFPELLNLAGKSALTLSVALLLTFLLVFVSGVSTEHDGFCKAVAAITHFFWLSIFFWMNALAIDLNRTFGTRAKTRVASKSKKFYVWYSLYAWGVPALIVGACLVIDVCGCTNLRFSYGNDELCWLSSGDANLYAFGVPLLALLFLNAILFIDTVVGIRLTKRASEKALKKRPALAKAKEELSLYIKLSGVMGFTWILVFICEYANVPELWYLFTAVNSLQGVFILLAFGYNKRIITLWKVKLGMQKELTSSTSGDNNTESTSTGTTRAEK